MAFAFDLDNETSSVKISEKTNIPFPLLVHMRSVLWFVSATSVEAQAPTQGGCVGASARTSLSSCPISQLSSWAA